METAKNQNKVITTATDLTATVAALTPAARALYDRLVQERESYTGSNAPEGCAWGSVYIGNCQGGLTNRQFAGYLGSLKKAGLYSPGGTAFGDVLYTVLPAVETLSVTEAAPAPELNLGTARGTAQSRAKAKAKALLATEKAEAEAAKKLHALEAEAAAKAVAPEPEATAEVETPLDKKAARKARRAARRAAKKAGTWTGRALDESPEAVAKREARRARRAARKAKKEAGAAGVEAPVVDEAPKAKAVAKKAKKVTPQTVA